MKTNLWNRERRAIWQRTVARPGSSRSAMVLDHGDRPTFAGTTHHRQRPEEPSP